MFLQLVGVTYTLVPKFDPDCVASPTRKDPERQEPQPRPVPGNIKLYSAWYAARFTCYNKAADVGEIDSIAIPFRVNRSL